MPIAKFQMPDGRIARFEVPEGTTPEEAQRQIQNWSAQSTGASGVSDSAPGPDRLQANETDDYGGFLDPNASRFEKFKLGLAESGIKTGLGVKSLFTDLSDEDKAVLKLISRDTTDAGGWATAGNVTGDIAQLLVPAGAVTKGAKGLAKAKGLAGGVGRAMSGAKGAAGAEIGVSAGLGALRAPTEGKTRSEGAWKEGGAAALGAGAGAVLGKALRGMSKTPTANMLLDKGVKLTPAQAAKKGLPRTLAYLGNITPFVAKSFRKIGDEADASFSKSALQEAAPKGVLVKSGGQEGQKQLKQGFKKAYSKAWAKAEVPDLVNLINMRKNVIDMANLSPAAKASAKRVNDAIVQVSKKQTTQSLSRLDSVLRKELDRASRGSSPDFDVMDVLKKTRQQLLDGTNPAAKKALKDVNEQFGKYAAVRRAATNVNALKRGEGLEGGVFNPDELMTAVKAMGGSRAELGQAPMQQFAKAGTDTIGRKDPQPILDFMKGAVGNIPAPTPLYRGIGALMMQTSGQQGARALQKALRAQGISGATIGAALSEED